MTMSPGRLNRRVTLKRKTQSSNGKGGFTVSWPDIATVWAEVLGQNGREALLDQVVQGISFFRITLRWRADLADADQIRYGTLDLNIRSIIDPDGRREWLQINADTASALLSS